MSQGQGQEQKSKQKQEIATQAYLNLCDSCKSPETKRIYIKALRYFMGYLRLDSQDYNGLLEKDPATIQTDITSFIRYLRKDHSSATVSTYIAAIRRFYFMNDMLQLNWNKIHSFEGEKEKQTEDRPYTHSEIRLMIDRASPRNKAIILLMASAGIRVGAIPPLRIKDLEPNDRYNIYKITVYPRSKNARYYTFCSPECRQAINSYLEWRKRFGERFDANSDTPLFRRDYNARGERIPSPQSIQRSTITRAIILLLKDTGIRSGVSLEPKHKRYEIMTDHGFRKFYETNAFRAGMNGEYIRRLLGQKGGQRSLEDAYLKLSEEELLEGDSKHVGYIGIIDQLTINEENKLRRKVETLTEKQDEIQKMKDKHEQEMKSIREEMNTQFTQVMELIRENPKLAKVKPEVLAKKKK